MQGNLKRFIVYTVHIHTDAPGQILYNGWIKLTRVSVDQHFLISNLS